MKKRSLKVLLLCLAIIICMPFQLVGAVAETVDALTADMGMEGTNYYIDDVGGDDTNTGTSVEEAWKTLDKVNATEFLPGDQILFKAGGKWTGMLHPKGSGTADQYIYIGKYGEGEKPLIAGEGSVESAVYIYNQQYWEISHLEVTNKGAAPATSPRRGVHVSGEDFEKGNETNITDIKVLRGIYLHDLYVHDVNGQDEKDVNGSSGIQVSVKIAGRSKQGIPNPTNVHQRTTFDDVRIINNIVRDVSRSGIMVWNDWMNRELLGDGIDYGDSKLTPWTPITNVVIRGNKLYNIGGDGIVPHMTDSALVEYNYLDGYNRTSAGYNVGMWTWAGDNTLYQFNEVTGGYSTRDGQPFDFDHGTQGIIYQYNYTYNNDGGTLLLCADGRGGGVRDNIFRYNISQNDKYQIFTICGGSNISNIQIYNNLFYVEEGMDTNMLVSQGAGIDVTLYNNIFINYGTGKYTAKPTWKYQNNAFFGNNVPTAAIIPDPFMITDDPMLVDPGKAGTVLNTGGVINPGEISWAELEGYKLGSDSALINAGRFIGIEHDPGGRDFFDNSIYNGMPDVGAHEYDGEKFEPVDPFEPVIPKPIAEVKNGDFENTAQHANGSPWLWQWNAGISNDGHAYEGEYAGYIQAASSGGSIEQSITVSPNTTYRVAAYTKLGDETQEVYFGLHWLSNSQKKTEQMTVKSTEYEKSVIEFTTDEDVTGITLYYWQNSGPNNRAYIDQVTIEEVITTDKGKLLEVEVAASKLLKETVVGDQPGEVSEAAHQALEEEITAAQIVLDDEAAEQSVVDEAVTRLEAAIKAFEAAIIKKVVGAEKTALEQEKAEAVGLLNDTFVGTAKGQVPQSAKDALQTAIATVQSVLDDEAAEQAEVDEAVISLEAAIETFKAAIIKEVIGAEKTALEQAKAEAVGLLNDTQVGTATGQVPQSAKDALQTAIATVQSVLDDEAAEQSVVDASTANLNEAIKIFKAAIIKKVTPPTRPTPSPSQDVLDQLIVEQIPTEMQVSDTKQAKVTAIYTNGIKSEVTAESSYRTSDALVVEVSTQGGITAKSAGSAIITVSFKGKSQTVEVIVKASADPGTDTSENPETGSETPKFTDIANHWANAAITKLAAEKLMKGYGDGSFKPDQSMTRAELTTLLIRVLKQEPQQAEKQNYLDVSGDYWAKGYIDIAVKLGIVKGQTEQIFAPEVAITRQQFAVIIARAYKWDSSNTELDFTDKDEIAPWARDAVQALVEKGIMKGYADGSIKANQAVTRAEAASMIARLLQQ